MAAFILDCSITLAWFFTDEQDAYADSIAANFPNAGALVPEHWSLEVTNTMTVGERRNRCTVQQSTAFIKYLDALVIIRDHETERRAWADTLALVRKHSMTSYDAAYLELAVRERLPIATLDQKLLAAALAEGISAFQP